MASSRSTRSRPSRCYRHSSARAPRAGPDSPRRALLRATVRRPARHRPRRREPVSVCQNGWIVRARLNHDNALTGRRNTTIDRDRGGNPFLPTSTAAGRRRRAPVHRTGPRPASAGACPRCRGPVRRWRLGSTKKVARRGGCCSCRSCVHRRRGGRGSRQSPLRRRCVGKDEGVSRVSRLSAAAIVRPSGILDGRSFALCTARSSSPRSNPSSRSLTKRPLPPASLSGASCSRSPPVLTTTRSTIAKRGETAGDGAGLPQRQLAPASAEPQWLFAAEEIISSERRRKPSGGGIRISISCSP